ncbi:DinB superfamily protein [Flavobacterium caseinilyticum]|uniref:DinB superfamily protein n=1 Tax=Flavobacterium caseinilyticum TaxID=2541732 RepID=UPI0026D353B0|nr:DinB superfamily protein [Flavobacterium caseinilyticum]
MIAFGGKLNTNSGAEFGKIGYIRNRLVEFLLKDIRKAILSSKINQTIDVVNKALTTISSQELKVEYPILIFENKTSTEFMFIHLTTQLAYHLGQIN